jgi:intracellular septation protein A
MEFNKQTSSVRSSASEAIIDQGLRTYMLKVYNYMASGVLLTGFIALLFFKMAVVTGDEGQIIGLTNFGNTIYASGLKWVLMLAPLGVVFYMSFGIAKMSASKAQTTFWVFAALMGASISSIFLLYTGASITRVFFITSGTFGAMSIYGYTTKKDLTKLGSFLMMGLFGITILVTKIFFNKNLIKIFFKKAFELNELGWDKLNFRWSYFFIFLAILNEVIWRTQSEIVWVNFKVWGILPLTLIFTGLQLPLINKHKV